MPNKHNDLSQLNNDSLYRQLGDELRDLGSYIDELKKALVRHEKVIWFCLPEVHTLLDPKKMHDFVPKPGDIKPLIDAIEIDMSQPGTVNPAGIVHIPTPSQAANDIHPLLININELKVNIAETTAEIKKRLTKDRFSIEANTEDGWEDYEVIRSEYLAKGRDQQFHMILRSLGFPSINFRRVTKRFWVAPHEVIRFKYVWAKWQYRKRKLKGQHYKLLKEHYERIGYDVSKEQLEVAMAAHGISPDTELWKLVDNKPALKFNAKVIVDDKPEWISSSGGGISFLIQPNKPLLTWMAKPTDKEVADAKQRWLENQSFTAIQLTPQIEVFRD